MTMRPITRKKPVRVFLILLLVAVFVPPALVGACYLTYYLVYKDKCYPYGIPSGTEGLYLHIRERLHQDSPDYSPQWTPNGKHIVFAKEDVHGGPAGQVYVVASDGSSLRSIERDEALEISRSPTISPDGSRIAFSSYRGQKNDRVYFGIETAALYGTNQRRLTEEAGWDFSPVWSPSGNRIAFSRHGDLDTCGYPRRRGIYTIDADGSNIHEVVDFQLQNGDGTQEERNIQYRYHSVPVWSPDSRLLAYVVAEREGYREHTALYTVNADGSDLMRLLTFSLILQDYQWRSTPDGKLLDPSIEPARSITSPPAWSPDGQQLAFVGVADGVPKLYAINRDGSELREVIELPDQASIPGQAFWSREGLRIMFSQGRTLYSVNADGSDLHSVHGGDYFSPAPDEARIAHLVHIIGAPRISNVVLYTTTPDGSDPRLLVRRRDDGELEAVGPEDRPSTDVSSCSAGVVVPNPESNPELVRDCEALARIFDRLVVAEDLNWDVDTPISEWEGVTLEVPTLLEDTPDSDVTRSPPRVRGLSLPDRGLVGSFPFTVTELTGLLVLDISGNDLGGPIPPELGSLKELRVLNLDNDRNHLRGPIPSELGNLSNLRELTLAGFFTGPIPPELSRLANLETLTLYGRFLSPIPSDLGNLSALKTLNLINSQLSGSIPPELGNLRSLEGLNLSSNDLTGPIPPELGNLQSLEGLNLSSNDLTGPIPPELGNLRSLEWMALSFNELSGPVPSELGNLRSLEGLNLSLNRDLTGCIPTALREQAYVDSHLDFCDQAGR